MTITDREHLVLVLAALLFAGFAENHARVCLPLRPNIIEGC